jgi:LmbE family N-acetylglucosaminyl deacetylase
MRPHPDLERLCSTSADAGRPSTLVVAAHPDDEVIGAGALVAKLQGACTVVFLTDGAPMDRRFYPASVGRLSRAAYGRARREEAARALALAGLDGSRIVHLGLRDQEVVFELIAGVERFAALLASARPEVVLTHAYEGGHPDHDAGAFVVHAAAGIAAARGVRAPTLVEMTSYHDRGGTTVRGEFLPSAGATEVRVELDDEERRCKRAMLAAYATQREVLGPFRADVERFRVAPSYDFGAPPQEGRLHYERFGFGVGGAMWRAMARAAIKKLGLPEGKL